MSSSVDSFQSHDFYGQKWDRCLTNAIKYTGAGLGAGVLFSVILFRRKTWPIGVATGFGSGMAFTECKADFASGNSLHGRFVPKTTGKASSALLSAAPSLHSIMHFQSTVLTKRETFTAACLDVLFAKEGRSADIWVDFNLFGHQIVAHVSDKLSEDHYNSVDGDDVPVPHFGCVLDWETFDVLAARLKSKNVKFIIEPHVRFSGLAGEQKTMFFKDYSNNNLEFKAMKNPDYLFQKQ